MKRGLALVLVFVAIVIVADATHLSVLQVFVFSACIGGAIRLLCPPSGDRR